MGACTEFTTPVDLVPGQPYYATVEACNGVLLCSTAASNKLIADDSAPLPGVVMVGHDDEHQHYVTNT